MPSFGVFLGSSHLLILPSTLEVPETSGLSPSFYDDFSLDFDILAEEAVADLSPSYSRDFSRDFDIRTQTQPVYGGPVRGGGQLGRHGDAYAARMKFWDELERQLALTKRQDEDALLALLLAA